MAWRAQSTRLQPEQRKSANRLQRGELQNIVLALIFAPFLKNCQSLPHCTTFYSSRQRLPFHKIFLVRMVLSSPRERASPRRREKRINYGNELR